MGSMPGSFPEADEVENHHAGASVDGVEELSDDDDAKTIADAVARLAVTHEDVVIAVMGITGTGKSTFISHLTQGGVEIGRSLKSCTAKIGIHPVNYRDGRTIYLIDTPGFDDTYRSDTQVLKDVAYFLGAAYSKKVKLAGIIYLHRINDNRMGRHAIRNLALFQKLCGTTSLTNVVLATTMWDTLKNAQAYNKACQFESELQKDEEFWADMIQEGSRVFRQDNGYRSAYGILDYIMGLQKKEIVADVAKQLVDEHLTLEQTAAGKEVQKELLEAKQKHQEELQATRESLQAAIEANNQRLAEKYARMEDECKAKIKQSESDVIQLRQNWEKVQQEKDEEYRQTIAELREQSKKYEDEAKVNLQNYELIQHRQQQSEEELIAVRQYSRESESRWQEKMAQQDATFHREQEELRQAMERKNEELRRKTSSTNKVAGLMGALAIGAGFLTLNPVLIAAGASIVAGASASSNSS